MQWFNCGLRLDVVVGCCYCCLLLLVIAVGCCVAVNGCGLLLFVVGAVGIAFCLFVACIAY